MKTEKGVIITAYKETRGKPRFIVLKRKKNWEGWEIPKGHLEKDNYRKTVEIELREEAGIQKEKIESINDQEETVTWTFKKDGEKIKKEYKAFIVKVEEDTYVDISKNPCDEHESGLFLRYRDVKEMLTYEDQKKVLEKAYKKITEK